MRLFTLSFTGLAAALCVSRVSASWYVYSERTTPYADGNAGQDWFKFYRGPPDCNDVELISFVDNVDVEELATSSARLEGGTDDYGKDAPVEQFEWKDSTDENNWGHHSKLW